METCAMGGLCGAALPPLFIVCLDAFGYRPTLIGWAVAVLIFVSLAILCIRPRTNVSVAPRPRMSDFNFLRSPLFWVLFTATLAQGLGQYIPSIYIPLYAVDIGLAPTSGALLLSLLNLAEAIGMPLMGSLV